MIVRLIAFGSITREIGTPIIHRRRRVHCLWALRHSLPCERILSVETLIDPFFPFKLSSFAAFKLH